MKFTPDILGPIDLDIARTAMRYFVIADNAASNNGERGAQIDCRHFTNVTMLRFGSVTRHLIAYKMLDRIRVRRDGHSRTLYRVTDLGRRLAAVQPTRWSRARMEVLWGDTRARIDEVNQDDRFLCDFKIVVLFGSFLHDQEDYGDLDLAIIVGLKDSMRGLTHGERDRLHLSAFPADRRKPVPWQCSQRRAARYVKNKNKRVEMHWLDDFFSILRRNPDMPYRVIHGNLDDYRGRFAIPKDNT